MSLNRFQNSEKLSEELQPVFGEIYPEDILKILEKRYLFTLLQTVPTEKVFTETHIYTLNNDYLGTKYNNSLLLDTDSNSLFIDSTEVFKYLNITVGTYKFVVNVHYPIIGHPLINRESIFVEEIAPLRNEVKLVLNKSINKFKFQEFKEFIYSNINELFNVLSLNFGENRVYKILNIKFDDYDENTIYVKTQNEIDESVVDFTSAWFDIELVDSYIDTIHLKKQIEEIKPNQLRGPDFSIDVNGWDAQSTAYMSWEQLLDVNAPTAQSILDKILNKSGQATINIDYTDFKNYIFYSRATERIENFKFKVEQIEKYNDEIFTLELNNNIQNNSKYSNNFKQTLLNRIEIIENSFDPFERWMYHYQSGSIFTHDESGSMQPWPKYENNNRYILHRSDSPIVNNWYMSSLLNANEYDEQNDYSLWWSIPEHILMDESNSEYVAFVNMVGQHFDTMYMYVNALTKIHEKDEHPERGISNDLLYHLAKSFGWDLFEGNSLSKLWLYKLGTDQSGSMQNAYYNDEEYASYMKILPHELQTKIIWRRIVNNLPFLLKTKGTSRSIKALMSIYGIPQTLISIKEYGGPGLENAKPVSVENRFVYKLNINNGQYIDIPQDYLDAHDYGWGKGSWCGASENNVTKIRYPDTYEFRFSTTETESTSSMTLFKRTTDISGEVTSSIKIVPSYELTGYTNYSGSNFYGKILYTDYLGNQSYSEWLPLYDGDLWTVRLYNSTPIIENSDPNEHTLNEVVQVARTSDYLYGRIVHESEIVMDEATVTVDWSSTALNVKLGGDFIGSLQEYKEYFTTYNNETFENHVLNPNAYNTDSPSGSFYSLYRYYPLGGDTQRFDHTIITELSSSQPDRSFIPTPAQIIGYNTGGQNEHYTHINETYYSQVPKIGDIPINGEKIRLEDSFLKYELSPSNRSEISDYDDRPTDTRKLAIVFSTADYINRDISNHMGFSDLDDWVASPVEEFVNEYSTLRNKRSEYFRKYTQKNNYNALIKLLSLYDYTFFEQIKQLAPGRADLITGILIEPHILDRSKVPISKLPTVTNPQWKDTITPVYSQSGDFPNYKGIIDYESKADVHHFFESGSVEFITDINTHYNYKEAHIIGQFDIETLAEPERSGTVIIRDHYESFESGSVINEIKTMRGNNCYKRKITYYDAYPISLSNFKYSNFEKLDEFTQYWETGSVQVETSSIIEMSSDFPWKNIVGGYRWKKGMRVPVTHGFRQFVETIPDKHYMVRVYAAPYRDNPNDEFFYDPTDNFSYKDEYGNNYNTLSVYARPSGSDDGFIFYESIYNLALRDVIYPFNSGSEAWLRDYRYYFTGSGNDEIGFFVGFESEVPLGINGGLLIYTVELHEAQSKYQEGWTKRIFELGNRSHLNEGSVYENWYYQINECSTQNNSRYKGSKLSGPGINVDSKETVDGGPVIEIFTTNPNRLTIGKGDSEGNLRI